MTVEVVTWENCQYRKTHADCTGCASYPNDCAECGEPHIINRLTIEGKEIIVFWRKPTECPNCGTPFANLVFFIRAGISGHVDAVSDAYRCPECSALVSVGVTNPVGMCIHEVTQ